MTPQEKAVEEVFEEINSGKGIKYIDNALTSIGGDPYVDEKWFLRQIIKILKILPIFSSITIRGNGIDKEEELVGKSDIDNMIELIRKKVE